MWWWRWWKENNRNVVVVVEEGNNKKRGGGGGGGKKKLRVGSVWGPCRVDVGSMYGVEGRLRKISVFKNMGNQGKMAGNSKICIQIQSQLILPEFIYLMLFL